MPNDSGPTGGIVHEIRWSDALPWWILFRAAGAAFSPTVILLAALGAAAVWAGGSVADRLGLVLSEAAPAAPSLLDGIALTAPDGGPVTVADPLRPSRWLLPWLHEAVGRLPAGIRGAVGVVFLPFSP
jgi:hypothetical protein